MSWMGPSVWVRLWARRHHTMPAMGPGQKASSKTVYTNHTPLCPLPISDMSLLELYSPWYTCWIWTSSIWYIDHISQTHNFWEVQPRHQRKYETSILKLSPWIIIMRIENLKKKNLCVFKELKSERKYYQFVDTSHAWTFDYTYRDLSQIPRDRNHLEIYWRRYEPNQKSKLQNLSLFAHQNKTEMPSLDQFCFHIMFK